MKKTDYLDDFRALAAGFDINTFSKNVEIEGHREFRLQSLPFTSRASFVYPESGDYSGKGNTFTALLKYFCSNNKYSNELIFNALENPDKNIAENNSFRIPVFTPSAGRKYERAVFLLHGLNEKHWEKYLPWALRIMEETDSPVILFPIAFHMNRAPESWGSPRDMMKVAAERKRFLSDGADTSFINAALSHRIQFAPHRFFSSGMQTYYDIISFIEEIRLGLHPFLSSSCRFDFFSYSIGASLTEVLMSSNYNGYFTDSKAFLFCGGAALDTAAPVSKTIIDSAAHTELFSWLAGLFDSVGDLSRRVKDIFFQELPEVLSFKSFLFYEKMQSYREESLKKNRDRIKELSLEKDTVFTPESTARTLCGQNGDTGILAESTDFPYEYRHEDPFPLDPSIREDVNQSFNRVFDDAVSFISCSA